MLLAVVLHSSLSGATQRLLQPFTKIIGPAENESNESTFSFPFARRTGIMIAWLDSCFLTGVI